MTRHISSTSAGEGPKWRFAKRSLAINSSFNVVAAFSMACAVGMPLMVVVVVAVAAAVDLSRAATTADAGKTVRVPTDCAKPVASAFMLEASTAADEARRHMAMGGRPASNGRWRVGGGGDAADTTAGNRDA